LPKWIVKPATSTVDVKKWFAEGAETDSALMATVAQLIPMTPHSISPAPNDTTLPGRSAGQGGRQSRAIRRYTSVFDAGSGSATGSAR
jgi:hypothetical protein